MSDALDVLGRTDELEEISEKAFFYYNSPADINIAIGEVIEENIVNILIFTRTGEPLYMHALLDTSLEPNMICEATAKETGFDIEAYL